MSWEKFPALSNATLSALRRSIDGAFRSFTREHGEMLETLFIPLRDFLLLTERLLTKTPWPVVFTVLLAVAWFLSRSWKITLSLAVTLFIIGMLGMWDSTMQTLAMIVVATLVSIVLGLPIGILISKSDRLQRIIIPLLDIMQTMPSFVYLIPILMLLGIGRVPGLIAVVIYSIAPVIRFTNLGIRLVDKSLLEAADAFGSSPWQKMYQVQLPLSLPTLMAGVNQTIMLALSMVVVASMIGVKGLGQSVLQAIQNQYLTMGILNGLAIVGIAVLLDRVTQTWGKRLQKHLEVIHG